MSADANPRHRHNPVPSPHAKSLTRPEGRSAQYRRCPRLIQVPLSVVDDRLPQVMLTCGRTSTDDDVWSLGSAARAGWMSSLRERRGQVTTMHSTPGRSWKFALRSVVRTMRFVATAVAAIIRWWAPRLVPLRCTCASSRPWTSAVARS